MDKHRPKIPGSTGTQKIAIFTKARIANSNGFEHGAETAFFNGLA